MNDLELILERIREYHANNDRKRKEGKQTNKRKKMIIQAQRKKFKHNE